MILCQLLSYQKPRTPCSDMWNDPESKLSIMFSAGAGGGVAELGLQVRHKLNTRGLLVYLTDLLPRFTSDLVNTNYCFLKVLLFHRALSKLLPWANG
jgi:hypothetical protein